MKKNNTEDESSSQSFTYYGGTLEKHFCRCGHQLPLKTSWTKSNPGRRYWACPSYGVNIVGFSSGWIMKCAQDPSK
ncbi:hypothetical protein CASFOL_034820 [Castilleja foliolosa]|uniref:Zinc finger GRF-type domain-containing protein n=1 Tax=Castilleja foliolosa TaxID=1961234 RepID=A0ABD3BRR6_9LAMI